MKNKISEARRLRNKFNLEENNNRRLSNYSKYQIEADILFNKIIHKPEAIPVIEKIMKETNKYKKYHKSYKKKYYEKCKELEILKQRSEKFEG